MPDRHIHIVSFTIPYPPNYGGVIDVYYKIKALYEAGVKVHLHCFTYDRKETGPLEEYCAEILLYPRKEGFLSSFSQYPYIVQSRRSPELMANLLRDDHPILFEGLHCCYYLGDPRLEGRTLIYRESNIEHHYYYHLFSAEKNIIRKAYFLSAAIKLRLFQPILRHASLMLAVTEKDTDYLQQHFPGNEVVYLPSFHANEQTGILPGKGNYVLYHGNLSVAENIKVAEFLVQDVFSKMDYPCLIAGMNPPDKLIKLAASFPNIKVVPNPSEAEMSRLIREAQVHILWTFQDTGLKLKLLNTLYNGRFCIANGLMIAGTGLEAGCIVENDYHRLPEVIQQLKDHMFPEKAAKEREAMLAVHYSNQRNIQKLIAILDR